MQESERLADHTWLRRPNPERIGEMSPSAAAVLGQLFLGGPTWDGNLVSKSGRDELVGRGLAERDDGFQWLTRRGVAWARVYPVTRGSEGEAMASVAERWVCKQARC